MRGHWPASRATDRQRRRRYCRALFRQTGTGNFRAMLAVFRAGRRQHLAFGEHVLGPAVSRLAAQRHNRRRLHCTKHALDWAASAHELIAGVALKIEQGREIGVVHPRVRFRGNNRLRAVGDAQARPFQHVEVVGAIAHRNHLGG